jgi:predicted amidohydrolase
MGSVNLTRMIGLCERAARNDADLVVFCEAAVTGFAGRDDVRHDVGGRLNTMSDRARLHLDLRGA